MWFSNEHFDYHFKDKDPAAVSSLKKGNTEGLGLEENHKSCFVCLVLSWWQN